MIGVMVFDSDRVGAGGRLALEDGQVCRIVADKKAGGRAAADKAGFVEVEAADVGTAGGEAAFPGIGLRQLLERDIVPGVAAVKAPGNEKSPVDGVADYDAAVDIP